MYRLYERSGTFCRKAWNILIFCHLWGVMEPVLHWYQRVTLPFNLLGHSIPFASLLEHEYPVSICKVKIACDQFLNHTQGSKRLRAWDVRRRKSRGIKATHATQPSHYPLRLMTRMKGKIIHLFELLFLSYYCSLLPHSFIGWSF